MCYMAHNAHNEKPLTDVRVPLPTELHKRLWVTAAQRDLTIREAVVEAVQDWVAPTEPPTTRAPAKASQGPAKASRPTKAPAVAPVADDDHCASCGAELDRGDLMRGGRYYCARCYEAAQ